MTALPPSTRFHPLRVTRVDRETADAIAVTLAPAPHTDDKFHFTPGQYLTFRRIADGEELRRSYSICAAPHEGALRVGIKRVPGGRFSDWAVESLRPGDVLDAMPPEGRFGISADPAAPPRTILALACGSGITPVLSIASSILASEPVSRVVLLYGNRTAADIMFRTALEELKDRHLDRFALVHVLSREKHELESLHGRLDAARIQALLPGLVHPGEISGAFVCGPGGFAEGATRALTALGLAPTQIHVEHFTPASPSPARAAPLPAVAGEGRSGGQATQPPTTTATITLDGVTRDVHLLPGETILEAGLRAGLDVPWSCRGGMCCTCRAKVTEGEVAMATNYSLQPWELEAGFRLTCQSRPLTPHLAVDYDAT
jgi:ring-1,2-phenylacetyl-CoA epoxidase subunit PaaE